MNNKTVKQKIKKRRQTVQDYEALREQQKIIYLRQRRKIRKRQMMFHRIKSLLRLGSILFVLLGLLYVLLMPLWNIDQMMFTVYPNKSLIIEDNLITSDNQILSQLKNMKLPKKPIYLLDISNIEKRLLKLDTIKKVYLRRYWLPARLKIIIVEKQPLFIVYNNLNTDPIYAIATDGSKISSRFLPFPDKVNKEVFNIILNTSTIKWNSQLIDKYKELVQIAEVLTGEKLTYLDLTNPKDVYLKMSDCTIRLGEIDATVIQRISRLKLIMNEVKPLENNLEFIDLRWDKALSIKQRSNKKNNTNQTNNPDTNMTDNKTQDKAVETKKQDKKPNTNVIQFQKLLNNEQSNIETDQTTINQSANKNKLDTNSNNQESKQKQLNNKPEKTEQKQHSETQR